MKFLLDVHVAKTIGRALSDQGHSVVRASDGYADWSDKRLLELAVRDQLVVITEDRDFSDLIYRDGMPPPPAILYLRFEPEDQPVMADRVLLVLANTRIHGHMIVVRSATFRRRPLPTSRA